MTLLLLRDDWFAGLMTTGNNLSASFKWSAFETSNCYGNRGRFDWAYCQRPLNCNWNWNWMSTAAFTTNYLFIFSFCFGKFLSVRCVVYLFKCDSRRVFFRDQWFAGENFWVMKHVEVWFWCEESENWLEGKAGRILKNEQNRSNIGFPKSLKKKSNPQNSNGTG